MIVIICLCGAGLLGALTAVLVFFRKIVSDAEFDKHGRKLIGLVIALVVGVPIMTLLSMNDTRTADGAYVNGLVGQYLSLWSLLSFGAGFFLRVAGHPGRGSHPTKVIGGYQWSSASCRLRIRQMCRSGAFASQCLIRDSSWTSW